MVHVQGVAKHDFPASDHLHTRIKCVVWAASSSSGGSKSRHLLAVGCESGVVDVFDAVSGATVHRLANSKTVQGHTASVNDVSFDATGREIASTVMYLLAADPLSTRSWALLCFGRRECHPMGPVIWD